MSGLPAADPGVLGAYLDATAVDEAAGAPLVPELRRLVQAHPEPALAFYLRAAAGVAAERSAGPERRSWALRRLEEAAELIEATPSLAPHFQADLLRLRALLHLEQGADVVGMIEIESAMQAAMRHRDLPAAARILEDLAEAALAAGAPGPATCCNDHALRNFEGARDAEGAARCRRRSERIAAPARDGGAG